MKIAISGSTGFLGSPLTKKLTSLGHQVIPIVRDHNQNGIYWNLSDKHIEKEKLENLDAIIHLAGENIAKRRWTEKQKQKLAISRLLGTKIIAEAIKELKSPPTVFLSASAIGYYGDRGEEILDENSSAGDNFLAELAKRWEAEANTVNATETRIINARFGIILDPDGGALKKMLLPFKLALGGKLGSGKQYMSWISLEDCISAIIYSLNDSKLSGPANFVSPTPLTNSEFTKILANSFKKPAFFTVPKIVLKLILGQMADELLFASARVFPSKLAKSGFKYGHEKLEDYLTDKFSA